MGILSGVISLFLVFGIYQLVGVQFKDLFDSIQLKLVDFWDYAIYMLLAFIGIGILSGVGGSMITMRKYLNKEGSEIRAL